MVSGVEDKAPASGVMELLWSETCLEWGPISRNASQVCRGDSSVVEEQSLLEEVWSGRTQA
ncbi:MAG: hypothetical protein OJF50_000761 [Nitrospira sp.]|nr:hypothetical protein [Nitrospira sp.]